VILIRDRYADAPGKNGVENRSLLAIWVFYSLNIILVLSDSD
jgi:hypothetical protein